MGLNLEQKNRLLRIYFQKEVELERSEYRPIDKYINIRIQETVEGDKVKLCSLNDRGRQLCWFLLEKMGKNSPVGQGVCIEKRTWHSINQYDLPREEVVEAFRHIIHKGQALFWAQDTEYDHIKIQVQGIEKAIATVSAKMEWEKKQDIEKLADIFEIDHDERYEALKWVWRYLDDPQTRKNLNDDFTEIVLF